MKPSEGKCAACGVRGSAAMRMSTVVVEGRTLELCRAHAAAVAASMPETFDELRALFVGVFVDFAAVKKRGEPERRSPIERRGSDDRRVFPPRPESRRHAAAGRRTGDPAE